MVRTIDQNSLLHCWCREIATHLKEGGVPASETLVKELVLRTLGNTVEFLGEKIAMRSHQYKKMTSELSIKDLERGFIAMDELLTLIQAWASSDINLILKSPNEEEMIA